MDDRRYLFFALLVIALVWVFLLLIVPRLMGQHSPVGAMIEAPKLETIESQSPPTSPAR